MAEGELVPLLDANVDLQNGDKDLPAGCQDGEAEPKRRKTSKQPPGAKKKDHEKPKKRAQGRRRKQSEMQDDDEADGDDDEEGVDDEEDKENQAVHESKEADEQEKSNETAGAQEIEEKTAGAQEIEETKKDPKMSKRGAKAKEKKKGGDRDQSKSKKFSEIFLSLPGEIRDHVATMSRSDKTAFIHCGIERANGRLVTNTSAMFQFLKKKEESQGSAELMAGYVLEEHLTWNANPTPPPPPLQPQHCKGFCGCGVNAIQIWSGMKREPT